MELNLRMILRDLNIYGKCRAIVTDNASVMKSLADKLKIHHIGIYSQAAIYYLSFFITKRVFKKLKFIYFYPTNQDGRGY